MIGLISVRSKNNYIPYLYPNLNPNPNLIKKEISYNMENKITYTYKIIVIGDGYVGKTTLIKKFLTKYEEGEPYKSTVGATFHIKQIDLNSA